MTGREDLERNAAQAAAEMRAARGMEREAAERTPFDDSESGRSASTPDSEATDRKGEQVDVGYLAEVLEEANHRREEPFGEREITAVREFLPVAYEPIGDSLPLEVEMRGYRCDGHWHPVPVYAPQGTAINKDGEVVSSDGLTLEELLDGVPDAVERGFTANVLHFFQSYCFHPGAVAEPKGGNVRNTTLNQKPGTVPLTVLTIDTGRVPRKEMVHAGYRGSLTFDRGGQDEWPPDVVRGHGPAIADLIGGMIGNADQSLLLSLQPHGNAYRMQMSTPNGPVWVRAFDTGILVAALNDVEDEYQGCHVLNLSLGTPGIPSDMASDYVGQWIDRWLAKDPSRYVVAAAGNHGTCVPTWPAAHSADWSSKKGPRLSNRDRLFSVGSPRSTGFSAYSALPDNWIGQIRTGKDVEVAHPMGSPTSWTGTSFAAPQVAAELALGILP